MTETSKIKNIRQSTTLELKNQKKHYQWTWTILGEAKILHLKPHGIN